METATGVQTDSLETLVREADDMRGDVNWLSAEMFREVGPVRPSVNTDRECTEMCNSKLGFFAPFSYYYLLESCCSLSTVRNPNVVDAGWVSFPGLFL